MPKIFILLACEECDHCVVQFPPDGGYCADVEKRIPDIGEIAEFCELDDANKCPCPHYDNWDCQYYSNGKCELDDAEGKDAKNPDNRSV